MKRLENAPVDIVCASLVDEFSLKLSDGGSRHSRCRNASFQPRTPGRLIQLLDETKHLAQEFSWGFRSPFHFAPETSAPEVVLGVCPDRDLG